MPVNVRAYHNEIDPFAAEWLRNLIKAGTSRLAMSINGQSRMSTPPTSPTTTNVTSLPASVNGP
jgi:hypothetical protein